MGVVSRTQPIGQESPVANEGLCHKNLPAIRSQDLRPRWQKSKFSDRGYGELHERQERTRSQAGSIKSGARASRAQGEMHKMQKSMVKPTNLRSEVHGVHTMQTGLSQGIH